MAVLLRYVYSSTRLPHSARVSSPLFGFKKSAIILYTSVFRCLFLCVLVNVIVFGNEMGGGASHWNSGSFLGTRFCIKIQFLPQREESVLIQRVVA